jgi:predicted SAM-dependent methyltransferase
MINNVNQTNDFMWTLEIQKIKNWCNGKGADIGSGQRSPIIGEIRVDIDEKVKPDIVASGDDLPFKDDELDYLTAIHVFEHFEDQKKLLTEWLRVIKTDGIIAIVHPDVTYTRPQKPAEQNPTLLANKYYKHWHETTMNGLIELLEKWSDLPFKVIDYGEACPTWSFYLIIQKTK